MAKADKTGGQAFPTSAAYGCVAELYEAGDPGMSLADYFAACALAGYLMRTERPPSPEDAARIAYDYSAAMVKEREGR